MSAIKRLELQDEKFVGVCGGFGAYFHCDPVWFRLAFVGSTLLMGGIGLPFYLICWAIMPQKKPF